jgi:tight adherence protein C
MSIVLELLIACLLGGIFLVAIDLVGLLGPRFLVRKGTGDPPLPSVLNESGPAMLPREAVEVGDRKMARDLAMIGRADAAVFKWFKWSKWIFAAVVLLVGSGLGTLSTTPGLTLTSVAAVLAFLAPERLIANLAERRRRSVREELPGLVELLNLSLGAGLSIEAAISRTRERSDGLFPALDRALGRLQLELEAGRNREEAFQQFATDLQTREAQTLVNFLGQADVFGAGLTSAFARFTQEQRQSLYLDAERQAGQVPTLMTLPLLLCILPSVVAAIALPGMFGLYRGFLGGLGNG